MFPFLEYNFVVVLASLSLLNSKRSSLSSDQKCQSGRTSEYIDAIQRPHNQRSILNWIDRYQNWCLRRLLTAIKNLSDLKCYHPLKLTEISINQCRVEELKSHFALSLTFSSGNASDWFAFNRAETKVVFQMMRIDTDAAFRKVCLSHCP